MHPRGGFAVSLWNFHELIGLSSNCTILSSRRDSNPGLQSESLTAWTNLPTGCQGAEFIRQDTQPALVLFHDSDGTSACGSVLPLHQITKLLQPSIE